MPPARPLPRSGAVLLDARGDGRALRVSWHPEADLVVLSLWRDNVCAGSFRLPADDVPALVDALQLGLLSAAVAPPPPDDPGLMTQPVRPAHLSPGA